jgi:CheY-like chemotaxis protein
MVNNQILCKRLRVDKHVVKAVMNGQEAVDLIEQDRDSMLFFWIFSKCLSPPR